jgi:O-antigen/teichoic acid export membrane protein
MRNLFRAGGIPLNTVLVALRTITLSVVGIVMLPLLIDRIGKAPTGLFVFATTLTGYFTAIELGLATSVTKYTAELRATGDREHLNSVLRGSLLLMVAIGVIIAAALTGIALAAGQSLFNEGSVRDEAVPTLLVAAGMSLAYWPARLGGAALEGLERYDLRALVGIFIALANLGGIAVLTRHTDSTTVLVAYFGGLLVLEGLVCGAIAWPHLGLARGVGHWRGAHLRGVLGFGSALFVIGMADTLVYATDRTIVA